MYRRKDIFEDLEKHQPYVIVHEKKKLIDIFFVLGLFFYFLMCVSGILFLTLYRGDLVFYVLGTIFYILGTICILVWSLPPVRHIFIFCWKSKPSFLILLTEKAFQYDENQASIFAKKYQIYELEYARDVLKIDINRYEDRYVLDIGIPVLISLVVIFVNNYGEQLFGQDHLTLISTVVLYTILFFISIAFSAYLLKISLLSYKYKIALLEKAILQKTIDEKINKKQFFKLHDLLKYFR
ncbi:hypothetical protein HK18_07240 [Commensalibacter intestini]|uniref:Uncharacterized protein n=1 Tax=Commensalibacter intestini TaxID=479936 RepID=A0A251ZVH6_9PROT|nr:hypothetical protein [Commensalibacter intestini]OUI78675.1 hypothetical protein HK18_07240 [Commensalibacter intestini]